MSEAPHESQLTMNEEEPTEYELIQRQKLAPIFRFGHFKGEKLPPSSSGEIYFLSQCSMCSTHYLHPDRANTSTLKNHLQRKHQNILIADGEKAQRDIEAGKVQFRNTILSTDLLEDLQIAQKPISHYFPKETKRSNKVSKSKGKKAKKINLNLLQEKFALVVMTNNLSFKFCDNYFLQDFLKSVRPGLERLISSASIRSKVVEKYEFEDDKLRQELIQNEGRFALTLDEGRGSTRNKYLGITVHFYNHLLELKHYTIVFEGLKMKSITGASMRELFSRVLSEFGIERRILSITRDNSGPMNTLFENFENNYRTNSNILEFKGDIPCAGHAFNLSTNELLKYTFFRESEARKFVFKIRDINDCNPNLKDFYISIKSLPKVIRDIVKGVQGGTLQHMFAQARKSSGNIKDGPETLLLDNKRQWLSTFKMIESFLYFRKEIDALLERARRLTKQERDVLPIDVFEITTQEWKYLAEVKDTLIIYLQPTMELEASTTPTINLAISNVYYLLNDLESHNTETLKTTNPYLAQGLSEAHDKLYEYFPIFDQGSDELLNLHLATVLDPRIKLEYVEKFGFSAPLISRIKTHFKEVYHRYKKEYDEKQQERLRSRSRSDPSTINDFWQSRVGMDLRQDEELFMNGADEVTTYLSEDRVEHVDQVLDFYHCEKNRFPVLYLMAKDFLAIPAMSAPAEEVISKMGGVVTKRCDRVSTDLTKMVAFLKYRGALDHLREATVKSAILSEDLNEDRTDDKSDDESDDERDGQDEDPAKDSTVNADGEMLDFEESEGNEEGIPTRIVVED